MNIVFNFTHSNTFNPPSIEHDVRLIYRRLYRLMGVCSIWRSIIVNTGIFWSVIPLFASPPTEGRAPFELSLKRAGGGKLHLAAVSESLDTSKGLIDVLDKYGSSLHAANLSIRYRPVLVDAIDKLLQRSTVGLLTDLSIRFTDAWNDVTWLPSDKDYLVRPDHPRKTSFAALLEGLTTFRICGTHFYWYTMTFSTQLVELHIEQITLGYDDVIASFLQALSSASQLRDLKMIAADTFLKPNSIPNAVSSPAVFPRLQSLHVEDFYFNTLRSLLPMIARGSYRCILFLQELSLKNNIYQDEDLFPDPALEAVNISGLCDLLMGVTVDTLMLSGYKGVWMTGTTLRELLKAMPNLKILKIHRWIFGIDEWSGLTRRQCSQTDHQGHPFPALENFQLTAATIATDEGFQDMVASHPIQQVLLGAIPSPLDDVKDELSEERSGIIKWLKGNVPELRLVGSQQCPVEFHRDRWQLW